MVGPRGDRTIVTFGIRWQSLCHGIKFDELQSLSNKKKTEWFKNHFIDCKLTSGVIVKNVFNFYKFDLIDISSFDRLIVALNIELSRYARFKGFHYRECGDCKCAISVLYEQVFLDLTSARYKM